MTVIEFPKKKKDQEEIPHGGWELAPGIHLLYFKKPSIIRRFIVSWLFGFSYREIDKQKWIDWRQIGY